MAEKLPELQGKNKDLAQQFYQERAAQGSSEATIRGYKKALRKLSSFLQRKPFPEIDKQDMVNFMADLRNENAESTVAIYGSTIKKFFKWLNDEDEYPEEVDWISTTRRQNNKLPNELLNPEEIKQMIESCDRAHDRAMIAVLYESGARAGEFLSLNIGSVEIEQRMGRAILPRRSGEKEENKQKTGQRRIPLAQSLPYLQEWLNNHPLDGSTEPLWISFSNANRHKRLTYNGLKQKVKRIGKDAGIEKRIYPHLFRHSRATEVAGKGIYSEAEMRIIFGWAQGSNMPSKYIHLSGSDVDEKFKKDHGLIEDEEEEEEEPLEPIECPRCDYRNPAGAKFCNECGLPLETEAARELEEEDKRTSGVLSEMVSEEEAEKIVEAAKEIVEDKGS